MKLLLALCALLAPPAPSGLEAPTEAISVDVQLQAGDDEASQQLEQRLRSRLSERLLEDGYQLVPAGSAAEVEVEIRIGPEAVQIEARGAGQRSETVAPGDPALVALEIQQLTAALIDEVGGAARHKPEAVRVELRLEQEAPDPLPTAPEKAQQAEALPAPTLPASVDETPTPTHAPAAVLSLAAQTGVLVRVEASDPSFGALLRAGRTRGLGGRLELSVVPSRAKGVRVLDSLVTGGLDGRLGFGRRGVVTLAARAGAHIHRYVQTSGVGGQGVRVGPSVGALAQLAYLGPRGLLIGGGVHGGWSGGNWAHVLDSEVTWQRRPLYLGLGLSLGYELGLGRARGGHP